MKSFLYYFDKLTAWLDFSWLITIPKKQTHIQGTSSVVQFESPPSYVYTDPLLEPLLKHH
jgi:hypothetical protein